MDDQLLLLLKYVLIISTIISGTLHGLKKHIKAAKKLDSVPIFVTIPLTYLLGIGGAFLIKNPMISVVWQKILMGIIIGTWCATVYDSAIKSITELIPTLLKKIK